MADHTTLIFFRSGRCDLDTAAEALANRGMTVQRATREFGDELTVGYPRGPKLRVAFVQEPYVREEATEISDGTPHAEAMSRCDARFEVLIDDLDEVLNEINTLIEVQLTLQDAAGGFLFNTWNGELAVPGDKSSDRGSSANRPRE
jgi:hypothetical protein